MLIAQPLISNLARDAGGGGGNMASYFGRQQSAASMASLPPDEVEFELDLEVHFNFVAISDHQKYYYPVLQYVAANSCGLKSVH